MKGDTLMPLLVRNNEPNATIYARDGIVIRWGVAGDPNGEDVQRVPDSLAEDVDFLRSLDRGILSIDESTDDEIAAKIASQTATFQARRAKAAQATQDSLERRQDKDMVQVACVATTRGGKACDKPVLVRNAQRDAAPPLCDGHKHLSSQFIANETGSEGEGGKKTAWVRVRVDRSGDDA